MVETYVQVYRKDIYDAAGLTPAKTIEEWRSNNQKATSDNVKGIVVRGSRGGGMTGTGDLSTFRAYGGQVFDDNLVCQINSPQGVHIAEQYCASIKESGPPGLDQRHLVRGPGGLRFRSVRPVHGLRLLHRALRGSDDLAGCG